MDPNLVLSEEQKQVRFRNYLKKKANKQMGEGRQSQSGSPRLSPPASPEHSASPARSDSNARSPSPPAQPSAPVPSFLPVLAALRQTQQQQQQQQQQQNQAMKLLSQQQQAERLLAAMAAHNQRQRVMQVTSQPTVSVAAAASQPSQPSAPRFPDSYYRARPTYEMGSSASPSPTRSYMSSSPDNYASVNGCSPNASPTPEEIQAACTLRDFCHQPNADAIGQHNDDYVIRRIEEMKEGYFRASAMVPTSPGLIERATALHAFNVDGAHVMGPADLSELALGVGCKVRAFALAEVSREAVENGRAALAASLFFCYLLARYIGSSTGEDQLHWILEADQPQNLSIKESPVRLSLADFNARTSFLDESRLDRAQLASCVSSICRLGLPQSANGLLLRYLISQDEEALELLYVGVGVSPVDTTTTARMLSRMKDILCSSIAYGRINAPRVNLPLIDFPTIGMEAEEAWLAGELAWAAQAAAETTVDPALVNSFVKSAVNGANDAVLPSLVTHLECVARRISEMNPSGLRSDLLESNRLTAAAVLVARIGCQPTLLRQLQVLTGKNEEELEMILSPGGKQAKLNLTSSIGCPLMPKDAESLRYLTDSVGCVDTDVALLASAAVLSDGRDVFCRQLLERRLELTGSLDGRAAAEELLSNASSLGMVLRKVCHRVVVG